MTDINLNKTYTYIYELPYSERKDLCTLIDINGKWEELGGKFMKFDCPTLFRISQAPVRYHSPTDELLTLWGEQNHTILELFTILNEMQHYQAMTILKPFVDPKYHKLIFQGVKSFSNLVKTGSNIHNANGNHIEINSDNNPKENNDLEHEDLNKSVKINEQVYSDQSLIFSSAEACTPLITYAELEHATNYWNKSNILGKGGFGVVFRGRWKNTDVAIKRLEYHKKGAEQQFNILEAQRQQSLRELKYLNSCRHDNILSLYGFSIGGEKPCLVYQYMVNGSLEDRLQCRQGTKPLTWNIRFKIATGSARGLQFLHGMDKPLIHGDIKSANILLDPYFEPRIGDFGLAREGPLQEYTHVKVSHVHGTRPYLPDEFLRGKKFSTKVDTYSFGVVLFEIATGLRAYDKLRDYEFLKDYVMTYTLISDLADSKAGPDENNLYASLISIGKNCVSYKAKDRPEMEQVLRKLDCIMLQEKHSSIRHSFMPTNQYEPMKRLSTPSGSYHLQPWLFSPVPSNQLLKQNTSPLPHFGVATVPDQIEGAIMPPIEENNCLLKSTSNSNSVKNPSILSSTYEPSSVSKTNNNSVSSPQNIESGTQANTEKKNNNWKNSIPGEDYGLPLISELRIQSTDSS